MTRPCFFFFRTSLNKSAVRCTTLDTSSSHGASGGGGGWGLQWKENDRCSTGLSDTFEIESCGTGIYEFSSKTAQGLSHRCTHKHVHMKVFPKTNVIINREYIFGRLACTHSRTHSRTHLLNEVVTEILRSHVPHQHFYKGCLGFQYTVSKDCEL